MPREISRETLVENVSANEGTWAKIIKWLPIPTVIRNTGEDKENDPGAKGLKWRIKW